MGSESKFTRRQFTATGAGFAAGVFALRLAGASAQDATPAAGTPVAITPHGYISARLRQLVSADARTAVDQLVLSDFAPKVQELPGYGGYLLGDVIDHTDQNFTLVALDREDQAAGFNTLAQAFVATVADKVNSAATQQWAGDLLMWASPSAATATPEASPAASPAAQSGYMAFRYHASKPGTDPRDFVPAAIKGFLPIITSLPGFKGYLWWPVEGGFAAVSLYDSLDAANASNAAAKSWATANLALYTDASTQTAINSNVVFADLPILTGE